MVAFSTFYLPLCCCCLVIKSCLTLCRPVDYIPTGSSVHGISQERILECVAIFFSRGSSWPRDQIHVSCIARQILYHWATEEARIYNYHMVNLLGWQQQTHMWSCIKNFPHNDNIWPHSSVIVLFDVWLLTVKSWYNIWVLCLGI